MYTNIIQIPITFSKVDNNRYSELNLLASSPGRRTAASRRVFLQWRTPAHPTDLLFYPVLDEAEALAGMSN
jgi:hypothetical protein